jgi:hypothetical protein
MGTQSVWLSASLVDVVVSLCWVFTGGAVASAVCGFAATVVDAVCISVASS